MLLFKPHCRLLLTQFMYSACLQKNTDQLPPRSPGLPPPVCHRSAARAPSLTCCPAGSAHFRSRLGNKMTTDTEEKTSPRRLRFTRAHLESKDLSMRFSLPLCVWVSGISPCSLETASEDFHHLGVGPSQECFHTSTLHRSPRAA